MSKVERVRVRMYQVGFGDCFLVSLEYDKALPDGRAVRHLLIDYGSTRSAEEPHAQGRMKDVAKLIELHTQGELDVLVLTHRHKDHLFGFADNTGAATLRKLKPKLVLRPWTEDPDIAANANAPKSARFAARLAAAQESVEQLAVRRGVSAGLKAAAAEQVKNPEAIALLDELSEQGRGRYLFAGADSGVENVVPGLDLTVLGPPTVDQDERVQEQDEKDPEYWMLALDASLNEAAGRSDDDAADERTINLGPGPVRWLVEKLAGQKTHSVARLVRKLDDALNNTSLILLLEVGELSMLFPGDAQIENWQFTLDKLDDEPALKKKLTEIDLYKVGHHGSRNATPRSLHALWADRSNALPDLTMLMSTRPGVHGKSVATAVPRETLVNALKDVGTLVSTDDLDHGEEFVELVAEVTGGSFVRIS